MFYVFLHECSKGGENNYRYYNFVVIVESFIVALLFTKVFPIRLAPVESIANSTFLAAEAKRKETISSLSSLQFLFVVLWPCSMAWGPFFSLPEGAASPGSHLELNSVGIETV